jgi:hypothetical protein
LLKLSKAEVQDEGKAKGGKYNIYYIFSAFAPDSVGELQTCGLKYAKLLIPLPCWELGKYFDRTTAAEPPGAEATKKCLPAA